jgi:hypothetical protein
MVDGGLLRSALSGEELESRIANSAIQAGGFVLKLINTGHVDLCGADEQVYGIAVKSTKEFVGDGYGGGSWTAAANVPCLIQREGEALLQVKAGNAEIAIGATLQSTAGGTVDLITYVGATPTLVELRSVVGRALEFKAGAAAGLIKVMLKIGGM